MGTIYAATSITKEVCESSYEGDELARTCTMSENINVQAPTLAILIGDLGRKFGLNIDDVFLGIGDGEPVRWFDFDRYEDADGDPVADSASQTEEWKAGRLKVWHAVYSFTLEKRIIEPINRSEFESAGIRTH